MPCLRHTCCGAHGSNGWNWDGTTSFRVRWISSVFDPVYPEICQQTVSILAIPSVSPTTSYVPIKLQLGLCNDSRLSFFWTVSGPSQVIESQGFKVYGAHPERCPATQTHRSCCVRCEGVRCVFCVVGLENSLTVYILHLLFMACTPISSVAWFTISRQADIVCNRSV